MMLLLQKSPFFAWSKNWYPLFSLKSTEDRKLTFRYAVTTAPTSKQKGRSKAAGSPATFGLLGLLSPFAKVSRILSSSLRADLHSSKKIKLTTQIVKLSFYYMYQYLSVKITNYFIRYTDLQILLISNEKSLKSCVPVLVSEMLKLLIIL